MEAQTVTMLESLTPAEKVDAIDFLVRSLRKAASRDPASQNQSMRQLLQHVAKLPVHNPDDGFDSSDHDRELYRDKP
jgi:hypothetical protein